MTSAPRRHRHAPPPGGGQQTQLHHVVPAHAEHAFALGALVLQANRELGRPGEPGFLDRFADDWLSRRGELPAWLALTVDGNPVGCVILGVVEGVPRPGRIARRFGHLHALYVRNGTRGRGLEEDLLGHLMDYAQDQALAWVQASPDAVDPAVARRMGFADSGSRQWRYDLG